MAEVKRRHLMTTIGQLQSEYQKLHTRLAVRFYVTTSLHVNTHMDLD